MSTKITPCTSFAIRGDLSVEFTGALRVSLQNPHFSEEDFVKKIEEETRRCGYLLNKGDTDGWTVLHFVAAYGTEAIVHAVFQKCRGRPDLLSLGTSTGCTPLHVAAISGNPKTAHALITVGSPMNIASIAPISRLAFPSREIVDKGATPLDVCEESSFALKYLLKYNGGVSALPLEQQIKFETVDTFIAQANAQVKKLASKLNVDLEQSIPISILLIVAAYVIEDRKTSIHW